MVSILVNDDFKENFLQVIGGGDVFHNGAVNMVTDI